MVRFSERLERGGGGEGKESCKPLQPNSTSLQGKAQLERSVRRQAALQDGIFLFASIPTVICAESPFPHALPSLGHTEALAAVLCGDSGAGERESLMNAGAGGEMLVLN